MHRLVTVHNVTDDDRRRTQHCSISATVLSTVALAKKWKVWSEWADS